VAIGRYPEDTYMGGNPWLVEKLHRKFILIILAGI